MSTELKKEVALEIAHVLFTDIVGYSKLPNVNMRAKRKQPCRSGDRQIDFPRCKVVIAFVFIFC
jgi:hypothetical protein